MGFASHQEALDGLERHQAPMFKEPLELRNVRREVMGLEPLPIPAIDAEIEAGARTRPCQVNVRLRERDLERLDALARRHGLARTTLARILMNRAIRALAADDEGTVG